VLNRLSIAAAKKEVEPLVPAGVPLVKEFAENHTDTTVSFTVKVTDACAKLFAPCAGGGAEAITNDVRKVFKLTSSISTSNMHLFDAEGSIKRYSSVADIIDEFYELRLVGYGKRKEYMMQKLGDEVCKLSNRSRFILAVVRGDLIVSNRKKTELLNELHDSGYKGFEPTATEPTEETADDLVAAAATSVVGVDALARRYQYLLSMPLWSLTLEKVKSLQAELEEKERQYNELKATPITSLWLRDLNALSVALDEFDRQFEEDCSNVPAKGKGKGKKTAVAGAGKAKKAKAIKEYDSEDSMDELGSAGEDSDFDIPKKGKQKKAAAPKPAVKATAAKSASFVPLKPAAAPAPAVAALSSYMSDLGLDDLGLTFDAGDMNLLGFGKGTLEDRMAAKQPLALAAKAAVKAPKAAPSAAGKKRTASDERLTTTTTAANTKKSAGTKQAAAVLSPLKGSPQAKKKRAAKVVPVKEVRGGKGKGKATRSDDEDEDDSVFEAEASDQEIIARPKRETAPRARAKYAESEEEESEEEWEEDEDSDY
jgi:DNA topoisomerase-2